MTVKLHVGYIGKTRAGKRVEIVKTGGEAAMANDGTTYWSNGSYLLSQVSPQDIIGPWEEPAAKVGEWIGWNGGPCPVHPETVVEVSYGKFLETIAAVSRDWDNKTLPIIAYRVITPYVEPKKAREFWVHEKSRMSFSSKPNLVDAIHVREVLDDE